MLLPFKSSTENVAVSVLYDAYKPEVVVKLHVTTMSYTDKQNVLDLCQRNAVGDKDF